MDKFKLSIVDSRKGSLALCSSLAGDQIGDATEFLELLYGCGAPTLVLEGSALPEAFFELGSGVAGEFLQKVSNYRRRLVVLGDFAGIPGRAFADFVRESNRTGQVVFADGLDAAVDFLK